jgi:transcriptional regulator of acetoin/glycerol metabolism
MEILLNYDYPGNVRELENILEHALIICQEEVIELKHLPIFMRKALPAAAPEKEASAREGTPSEKERIVEALKRYHWRREEAAQELRMDRTTLWRKMKRYHLHVPA